MLSLGWVVSLGIAVLFKLNADLWLCTPAACVGMVVYDHAITFGQEVSRSRADQACITRAEMRCPRAHRSSASGGELIQSLLHVAFRSCSRSQVKNVYPEVPLHSESVSGWPHRGVRRPP